jgi:hypothetical protein
MSPQLSQRLPENQKAPGPFGSEAFVICAKKYA